MFSAFQKKLRQREDLNYERVMEACWFAKKAHRGQKRKTGEDYICHPLWIAEKLCEYNADEDTVIAALLHDTVEDTPVTFKEVRERFGIPVYRMVHGMTKLSKIRYRGRIEERKVDSFFRMILSSTRDLRVIFVKMIDRLHNLRTIDSLPRHKQIRIAQETADVFIPLANLLGAWKIMSLLEEECLRVLSPDDYRETTTVIERSDKKRKGIMLKTINKLKRKFLKLGLDVDISFLLRRKYRMMEIARDLGYKYDDMGIYTGIEVVTYSREDCYRVLSVLHEIWMPRFDKMKDYISRPKSNGYSAFHTSVFLDSGNLCDFKIMSAKMKERSEFGFFLSATKKKTFSEIIDEIILLQRYSDDNISFYEKLKSDILQKRIHVLTPDGDIVNLAEKSCPIDVAYKTKSRDGHHVYRATVNNKEVPLNTLLRDGDIVQIEFKKGEWPKLEWLKWVKSSYAKEEIKKYLKNTTKAKAYEMGLEDFRNILHRFSGLTLESVRKNLDDIVKFYEVKDVRDLFVRIGQEEISSKDILVRIFPENDLLFSEFKLKQANKGSIYRIKIRIESKDRLGILNEIVNTIANMGVNILETVSYVGDTGEFVCDLGLEVRDFDQFYTLCEKINAINSVDKVYKI